MDVLRRLPSSAATCASQHAWVSRMLFTKGSSSSHRQTQHALGTNKSQCVNATHTIEQPKTLWCQAGLQQHEPKYNPTYL